MTASFLLEKTDNRALNGPTFLQSSFWASLKECFGWKPYCFLLDGEALIVLVRKFAPFLSLAYVPYAPPERYSDRLAELSARLGKMLPEGILFIRYDLQWLAAAPPARPVVKSPADIQPPSTVLIDLTRDTDSILAGMKSKTRYNIRLADKKGVRVKRCTADELDRWYDLYLETGERDRIVLHSLEYYRKVFEYSSREGSEADVRLYMAESEGEYIAGIVTCFYKKTATYLYGASSNRSREKMPAYALQWKAICDAREAGCVVYDMFGIPPSEDPSHPMYGLYRFKTGFGGTVAKRAGCYDYPLNRPVYYLYRLAEMCRYFYFRKLRKKRQSDTGGK